MTTGGTDGGHPSRALEPVAEPVAAPGEPPPDGPDGPTQSGGGLVVGAALEVAEDDRIAVSGRESLDLLVEQLGPLAAFEGVAGVACGKAVGPGPRPFGGVAAGPGGHPAGHAVEPAAEPIAPADRAGPAGQDQECGLEGVLGVVGVAERAPADAPDHRPVPPQDRLEGRGVVGFDEAFDHWPSPSPATVPGPKSRPRWPAKAPASPLITGKSPLLSHPCRPPTLPMICTGSPGQYKIPGFLRDIRINARGRRARRRATSRPSLPLEGKGAGRGLRAVAGPLARGLGDRRGPRKGGPGRAQKFPSVGSLVGRGRMAAVGSPLLRRAARVREARPPMVAKAMVRAEWAIPLRLAFRLSSIM